MTPEQADRGKKHTAFGNTNIKHVFSLALLGVVLTSEVSLFITEHADADDHFSAWILPLLLVLFAGYLRNEIIPAILLLWAAAVMGSLNLLSLQDPHFVDASVVPLLFTLFALPFMTARVFRLIRNTAPGKTGTPDKDMALEKSHMRNTALLVSLLAILFFAVGITDTTDYVENNNDFYIPTVIVAALLLLLLYAVWNQSRAGFSILFMTFLVLVSVLLHELPKSQFNNLSIPDTSGAIVAFWVMPALTYVTWKSMVASFRHHRLPASERLMSLSQAQTLVYLACAAAVIGLPAGLITGMLGEPLFDVLQIYYTEKVFIFYSAVPMVALTVECCRKKIFAAPLLALLWFLALAGQIMAIPVQGLPASAAALFCFGICLLLLLGWKAMRVLKKHAPKPAQKDLRAIAKTATFGWKAGLGIFILVVLVTFAERFEWLDDPFEDTEAFITMFTLFIVSIIGWSYQRSRLVSLGLTGFIVALFWATLFDDDIDFNLHNLENALGLGIILTCFFYSARGTIATIRYHRIASAAVPQKPESPLPLPRMEILIVAVVCCLALWVYSFGYIPENPLNYNHNITFAFFLPGILALMLGVAMAFGSRSAGIMLLAYICAKAFAALLCIDRELAYHSNIDAGVALLVMAKYLWNLNKTLFARHEALPGIKGGNPLTRNLLEAAGIAFSLMLAVYSCYDYYVTDISFNRQYVSYFSSDSILSEETSLDNLFAKDVYYRGYYSPDYVDYDTYYAFTGDWLLIRDAATRQTLIKRKLRDIKRLKVRYERSFWSEQSIIDAEDTAGNSYHIRIPETSFARNLHSTWQYALLPDEEEQEEKTPEEEQTPSGVANADETNGNTNTAAKEIKEEEALPKAVAEALESYRLCCKESRSRCCFRIGNAYREAYYEDMDKKQYMEEAARYFEKSCSSKWPKGCDSLARLYRHGMGVEKDLTKTRGLYKMSCDAGQSEGCYKLAKMIEAGEGGNRNYRFSGNMYRRLCKKNHAPSCKELGRRAEVLTGDPDKRKEAYAYFKKACYMDNPTSCLQMAYMLRSGDGVFPQPEKTLFFSDHYCNKDYEYACRLAGNLRLRGTGVSQDLEQAHAYYVKACKLDSPAGCLVAGQVYENGDAGEVCFDSADYYLGKACKYNFGNSCYRQAELYASLATNFETQKDALDFHVHLCKNIGTAESCHDALMMIRKDATLRLEPTDVDQVIRQAETLLLDQCNKGDAMSCIKLAEIASHFRAPELTADDATCLVRETLLLADTAYEESQKACEAGFPEGCHRLAQEEQHKREKYLEKKEERYTEVREECDNGSMKSCSSLGWLSFGIWDDARAMQLFVKACEAGRSVGCSNAAQFALLHDNRFKDALAYYEHGCRLGKSMNCLAANILGHTGPVSPEEPPGWQYVKPTIKKDCIKRKNGEACAWISEWYRMTGDAGEYKTYGRIAHNFWNQNCADNDAADCRMMKLWDAWQNRATLQCSEDKSF